MGDSAVFPLAVHYYRQPTPLAGEWERDLARIRELGFNAVQLRPHWRWHERTEGRFQWEDIDRLMDLAGKHGLRVIFKFMLETAPDWLYRSYPATRIAPDGRPIPPRPESSFYPGGWLPCFDAPEVRERAARFVLAGVERYRGHPALGWWHAWNEPRSRPRGECACPASQAGYRQYLRRRFGTVEELNRFLGKCWAAFEDVRPPAGLTDYAEMFLWRHWAAESVAERVRLVADAIRAADGAHPVMAHAGCCSPVQDALGDTCDDRLTAAAVDLYGSSLAAELDGDCGPEAAALNCDWIRAANRGRDWWINEAYADPALGFCRERGAAHVRHVALTPLAHGARGLVYWQYRAERLGIESGDDGLVAADGGETVRSREAARVGRFLAGHGALLLAARPPEARIALVYDFRADLLSAIEGACFDRPAAGRHPYSLVVAYAYKRALQGAYGMFWRAGLEVEWLDARDAGRLAPGSFRLAYLPLPFFTGEALAARLVEYVRGGGLLVAEAGLGLRAENTWLEPEAPGAGLSAALGYRLDRHFRLAGERAAVELAGPAPAAGEFPALEVFDRLVPVEGGPARPAGRWGSGRPEFLAEEAPAALECRLGSGRALALAFSPGLTFTSGGPKAAAGSAALAAALAGAAGVEPAVKLAGTGVAGVAARTLVAADGRRLLFLRNFGPRAAKLAEDGLAGFGADLWGGSRRERGKLVIPAGEFAVLFNDGGAGTTDRHG